MKMILWAKQGKAKERANRQALELRPRALGRMLKGLADAMPDPEGRVPDSQGQGAGHGCHCRLFFALADDNVRAGKSLKSCWSRCWNLTGWNLGETCWNLARTFLEISGTLLEPRWNPVAGTFGWNTLLGTSLGVDFVFLFAFLPLLTVSGCDVGNLA